MGSWSQSIVETKDQRIAAAEGSFVISPEASYAYSYNDSSRINITNELPETLALLLGKSLDMGQNAIAKLSAQVTQPAVEKLENQLSDQFSDVGNPLSNSAGSVTGKKIPVLVLAIGGIAFYYWIKKK